MTINHFRPHPWHGLDAGQNPPESLNAYIEITPFDTMKYEVDKVSGYLRVDRPQRSSAQHPALYGFIPRTYCGHPLTANVGEQSGPNNAGVARSSGELIAFLNHDDLWLPDHLKALTSSLERTGADLVFSLMAAVLPDGRPIRRATGVSSSCCSANIGRSW